MGWFDRLLGREKTGAPTAPEPAGFQKRGWTADSDDKRAATTREYLEAVGKALGIGEALVVPKPQDRDADLRGSASGFPLRICCDDSGRVRDITFRYADTGLGFIDLEYDPDMPLTPPSVEPWDASDKQVIVGPQVFLEGSDVEEEAARFRELPEPLQRRVVEEMRRLRIRYFRSRSYEFDITMHDDAVDVADPVGWLVDVMELALEVTGARGAVPPGAASKKGAKTEPTKQAGKLAEAIAHQIFGAKIVPRDHADAVDVRWTEGTTAVRIVLDIGFDDLDIEARVDGVNAAFSLWRDPEVSVDKHPETGDAWDDIDRHIFFAKNVYVHGGDRAARAEAALLRSMGSPLLDEVVRTMEEVPLESLDLSEQLLTVTLCDLSAVTDDGATAIRIARLMARVAAALPRGAVPANGEAVRCSYCHGLWFPSAAQVTCSHCGARA